MARSERKNRLSAPLMHAFRSAHADRAGRAARAAGGAPRSGEDEVRQRRNVITEQELRREVTQDIGALLNTVNLDSVERLDDVPEVRRSILNYGMPDIADRTIDEIRVGRIAAELEQALRDFEPRLVPEAMTSVRDETVDATELRLRFLVRADLLCNPVNVPVEFAAEVEVDTGKIRIDRL